MTSDEFFLGRPTVAVRSSDRFVVCQSCETWTELSLLREESVLPIKTKPR